MIMLHLDLVYLQILKDWHQLASLVLIYPLIDSYILLIALYSDSISHSSGISSRYCNYNAAAVAAAAAVVVVVVVVVVVEKEEEVVVVVPSINGIDYPNNTISLFKVITPVCPY